MIPLAWLLIAPLDLPGTGVAAVIASVIAFAVYLTRVRRSHGVVIDGRNLTFLALVTPYFFILALAFQFSLVGGSLFSASSAPLRSHGIR